MIIYCTGCKKPVFARLTYGDEMYPHREDLASLPFWICDICRSFVGCHHKWRSNRKGSNSRIRPLGVLATQEIKNARKKIHALLDPLWKSGKTKRSKAYAYVSKRLGYEYHTANIRTIEEARVIYKIVATLHNECHNRHNVQLSKEKEIRASTGATTTSTGM